MPASGVGRALRLGGALALLVWSGLLYRSHQEDVAWLERIDSTPKSLEVLDARQGALPRRPGPLRRLGVVATERAFPRRWNAAAQVADRWMEQQPFSTEPWLLLGQARAMTARPAEAQVAMDFAEQLAPSFPTARLQMLPVLVLQGQRQEAVALAREVAGLDRMAPFDVVPAMVQAGFEPTQIWETTWRPELTAEESVRLLARLPGGGRGAMEAIHSQLSESLLESAEFRQRSLGLFLQDSAFVAVQAIWARHQPGEVVAMPINDSGAVLWLQTPDRPAPPAEPFPFGWQRPPESLARSVLAPAEEGGRAWRILFRERTAVNSWTIHQGLAAAPVPGPVDVVLTIRHTAPLGQPLRLLVAAGGVGTDGPWSTPGDGVLHALHARLPRIDEAGPVRVIVERRGASLGKTLEFDVVSLSVKPATPDDLDGAGGVEP